MNKNKKIILLIVLGVGIPIILGIIFLMKYLFPNSDKITIIFWIGQISIVLPILILALIYRFWLSKKK